MGSQSPLAASCRWSKNRCWEMGHLGPVAEVLVAPSGVQPTPHVHTSPSHLVHRGPLAWPKGLSCRRGGRDN